MSNQILPSSQINNILEKKLNSDKFHRLMLDYRTSSILLPNVTAGAFEAVKDFILDPIEGLNEQQTQEILRRVLTTRKRKSSLKLLTIEKLAIKWCDWNSRKGNKFAIASMKQIEAQIGRKACLKKWNELRKPQ